MNSSQLEAILAIGEYGSINKAAEHLYITQPALKKRLDSLEAELQVTLVERQSTGCRLTEAGKILCEETPPILRQMHAVIDKVQNSVLPKRLRISQVSLLTLRYCDNLIAAFSRSNPEIRMERVFMTNDLWLNALRSNRIDLCLVPGTEASARAWQGEGLVPVSDGEGSLVAMLSPSHPLAGKKGLSLSDLKPYPVYSEPIMLEYSGLLQAAAAANVKVEIDEAVFDRYRMLDASARNCVFLHCAALQEDVAPMVSIPILDFSYRCFILLRTVKEPALRAFREFLLAREGKD